MTLREAYEQLGGDYDEVLSRLPSERLVKKFAFKFLEDENYGNLERAMETEDWDSAFRASHTIKGVCQNLGFRALSDSSSALTEALRNGFSPEAPDLFGRVQEDYERTVRALSRYREEEGGNA